MLFIHFQCYLGSKSNVILCHRPFNAFTQLLLSVFFMIALTSLCLICVWIEQYTVYEKCLFCTGPLPAEKLPTHVRCLVKSSIKKQGFQRREAITGGVTAVYCEALMIEKNRTIASEASVRSDRPDLKKKHLLSTTEEQNSLFSQTHWCLLKELSV